MKQQNPFIGPMSVMPNGMMSFPMFSYSPMMGNMTCEMTAKGMKCTVTPGEGANLDTMSQMCSMMTTMIKNGTPVMMTCNGMPMLSCCGMPMIPEMIWEMSTQGMMCMMMPKEGLTTDMLKTACDMMNKMMKSGIPMTITCGSTPAMVCMAK